MVEWKKLGEVCTFNRGRTITAKDAVGGDVPVIAGGRNTASNLFIANARSALNKVTAVEPAKSFANFKSVDITQTRGWFR